LQCAALLQKHRLEVENRILTQPKVENAAEPEPGAAGIIDIASSGSTLTLAKFNPARKPMRFCAPAGSWMFARIIRNAKYVEITHHGLRMTPYDFRKRRL
jgi:hypothetical protein